MQLGDALEDGIGDRRRQAHRGFVQHEQPRREARPRPIASICCSPPDSVPASWRAALGQDREQREDALELVRASRGRPACGIGAHLQIFPHRQQA